MSKAHIPAVVAIRGQTTLIGKKNGQIKGLIRNMWLIFYTQYNLSYLMFVPNFKILGQVVPEKSLTKNIGEIEKRKIEKEGKNKS